MRRAIATLAPALAGCLLVAACSSSTATRSRPPGPGTSTPHRPASTSAQSSTVRSSPTDGPTDGPTGGPTGAATSPADAAVIRRADARIQRLTSGLGRRGVSIATLDTSDGDTFAYGARHGMLCASVAKLYILETLLLAHQRSGHPLDADEQALAGEMIENSDNDAADALYGDIGEGAGLRSAATALGVRDTTPGSGVYWGYTRTGAGAYLALLRDLVGTGPLDHASRRYALHLLSHVEADQQWGVGSVADDGTDFYLKNGWLAVSTDADRWAVNSVGIATVHGHRLLMVVMTQHGASFAGGVELVDHLARIAAHAVTRAG